MTSNSGDVQAEIEDNSSRMEWKRVLDSPQDPFQLQDSSMYETVSLCRVDSRLNTSPYSTEHPAQACLGSGEKMFSGA